MNTVSATRPRDVQVSALTPEITVLRSRSWQRLRFEQEYSLQKGTTANSYLVQADQTALIDPPGETFTSIYLETLQSHVDLNTISYIILGHVNVNRVATLRALLDRLPQVTLICSNPAALTLRALLSNASLTIAVVRGEETLDLGKGHQLKFWTSPTLRWPDHLCTYDPATNILFSDKLFGCHVCADQIYDEHRSALLPDQQHYFQSVFARSAPQVETIIARLAQLPISILAPNHGPILGYGLRQVVQHYRIWSQTEQLRTLSVAILYASAYGNTAAMAQAVARGLAQADVGVDLINCEVATPAQIQHAVEQADGLLLGSPTLGGHLPTQMQTACGIVLAQGRRHQLVGVFGSYGWSGEAVEELAQKLQAAGFLLGSAPLRIKFKPTSEILSQCEQTGQDFAQSLKRSRKIALDAPMTLVETPDRLRHTFGDRRDQAMGRLVGSLCVLTFKRGDSADALLSSWIAQASFSPPGISVAIPKKHPMAALLEIGDCFTLNILQEGKQVRKHFQKTVHLGEDRFKGIELLDHEGEVLVLKEALAYLICRVGSRIECGDHWVIYGHVEEGKVIQNQGRSAVLYRPSGAPIERGSSRSQGDGRPLMPNPVGDDDQWPCCHHR
jgi:flavorubredoxin/flavin reductase (DIM6/NTAB) family NADH-FMN oxidoreductase RutF